MRRRRASIRRGDPIRLRRRIGYVIQQGGLLPHLTVERNIAVLFTEHSMDVVFAYADRMIVLARGRLIAEGKPAEIRDHPKVQEVYFGTGKTFEKKAAAKEVAA